MKEMTFANLCKRLSNPERVEVLRQVAICPVEEGLTVNDIADQIALKQPATSQYLKQLEEECGLVHAKRDGRYVRYRWCEDAAFGPATRLGPVIRAAFLEEAKARHFVRAERTQLTWPRILPALANEDRLRVVRVLREKGAATLTDIRIATHLTDNSARLHLGVILETGLIQTSPDGFVWTDPADPVSRAFLTEACHLPVVAT